jgi:hypothetical protein
VQTALSSVGFFNTPLGIAVESAGTLLVTDLTSNAIIRVDPTTGNQTVVSSGGLLNGPVGIVIRGATIYVNSQNDGTTVRVDVVTGAQEVVASGFAGPTGLAATPEAAPDLVVTALTNPPGTAARGTKFSVTDTTKNQGTGSTGTQEADATDDQEAAAGVKSRTRYYLSLNTTKDAGDKRLKGVHKVPVLAAGAQHVNTRNVTIRGNTAPNTYFILACADDTNKVAESNEGNNCTASTTTIVVTP